MEDPNLTKQIMLGDPICLKIKQMFYSKQPWADCYKLVAHKFSDLKKLMRKIYPEKTEIEILSQLQSFSVDDIKDVIEETSTNKIG